MEALVKYTNEPGRVEIREMPPPEMSPDQVLLRVCAVGICGSDLEMYHHTITFPVRPPSTPPPLAARLFLRWLFGKK